MINIRESRLIPFSDSRYISRTCRYSHVFQSGRSSPSRWVHENISEDRTTPSRKIQTNIQTSRKTFIEIFSGIHNTGIPHKQTVQISRPSRCARRQLPAQSTRQCFPDENADVIEADVFYRERISIGRDISTIFCPCK